MIHRNHIMHALITFVGALPNMAMVCKSNSTSKLSAFFILCFSKSFFLLRNNLWYSTSKLNLYM
jgi:uncharacterized protein with PQ loop repeat